MARKRGRRKGRVGRLLGSALSVAPAPVRIAAKVLGAGAKMVGMRGKGRGVRRGSRDPLSSRNLNRFTNQIIRAKMKARLQKIKMSAFRSI